MEIWDRKEGFEALLEKRRAQATKALGIGRKIEITITPLHNFFAPRLNELPRSGGRVAGRAAPSRANYLSIREPRGGDSMFLETTASTSDTSRWNHITRRHT